MHIKLNNSGRLYKMTPENKEIIKDQVLLLVRKELSDNNFQDAFRVLDNIPRITRLPNGSPNNERIHPIPLLAVALTEIGIDFLSYLTEIPSGLFEHCDVLDSVVIPDNIEEIGFSAFYGSSLTNVTFGKGIKSLAPYAFCQCSNLREVYLPKEAKNWNFAKSGVQYFFNKGITIHSYFTLDELNDYLYYKYTRGEWIGDKSAIFINTATTQKMIYLLRKKEWVTI